MIVMDAERKKELRLETEARNKQAIGWREQLGEENVKHIEEAFNEARSIAESLGESMFWGGQLYLNAGDFATMMGHIQSLNRLIKIEEIPEHLQ